MGPRIKLFFETFEDPHLKKKLGSYKIIRLKSSVLFKTLKGWSGVYDAIIDTGAHTTLIPLSIWKRILAKSIIKSAVQGISSKPGCSIPVIIGKVRCALSDEAGNLSQELETTAYLALTDETPLILGFKDLLDKFKIYFNYQNKEAYLEE